MADLQHPKVPNHTIVSDIAVGGQGSVFLARHDRLGPLAIDEAPTLAQQIAEALREAHSRNIVHRDLKPANVMLQSGNALLADFGLAKVRDAARGLSNSGLRSANRNRNAPGNRNNNGRFRNGGFRSRPGRRTSFALGPE